MKNAAVLAFLAASVATVSAQGDGTHECAKPNAAYCAGTSLGTDIIIRCDAEGKPQPGRCSNVCHPHTIQPYLIIVANTAFSEPRWRTPCR